MNPLLPLEDRLRGWLEEGFQGHAAVLRRELLALQGPVLDCGCGDGIFAGYFGREDYTGIDLSESRVRLARKRFPEHSFLTMDARRMDFPGGFFKRCFIAGVLHHLGPAETRETLSEIRRVLAPDGRFVIWEDVPAVRASNFAGRAAHFFDRGRYIRKPESYRRNLLEYFEIEEEYPMRSGFMDYIVFRCVIKKSGRT